MTHQASPSLETLRFFLGGRDLEMVTIRELLDRHAPEQVVDGNLGWGARTSSYRTELETALQSGQKPVLIELEDDLGLEAKQRVMAIDHHGPNAGADRPTALEQTFDLLGLPPAAWTRWHALVAANDRAYLAGMRGLDATQEEMQAIRAADRAAQGITEAEEAAAEEAIRSLESRYGGTLLIGQLPHARTAPLVDRLAFELGGPGFEILAVRSPTEVNVFGPGELIQSLADQFPNGWYGGNLPEHGYFGTTGDHDRVLATVDRSARELSKVPSARQPASAPE